MTFLSPRRYLAVFALAWLGFSPAHGETLNFNLDWKFLKADPPQAQAEQFDESAWVAVSAPHTFNDVDTFDNFALPDLKGELDQWSGRTWYRKTFSADKAWHGRKVFIEFEAVRQVAEVYLNGHLLGRCENGFLPFGFDLTPFLHFGGQPNVLAVMCDNRFGADSPYPWNNPQWHPAHGGIYRNVYLHIRDQIHFTLPLYESLGTVGFYNYATEIKADSALVTVEAEISNETNRPEPLVYRGEVLDATGQMVLSLSAPVTLKAHEKTVVKASQAFPQPHRWSPGFPYVYTIRHRILSGEKELDRTETPLGIRQAEWTLSQGLFLNGTRLKLRGWGQKPVDEWAGLGSAFPDWMHAYTLQMMRDAGGNFVRWGHCAGGPAQIRSCDALGLIVDQPGVDGEKDTTGHAWEVRLAAFRDTLVYFRNNPSILIWEGGNQAVTEAHVQELTALVAQYDPHGGRAYAHRRADATVEKYSQVSIGTEGQVSPRLPTVEGEYDREESPRRVWDNDSPPDFGYVAGKGQTYDLNSDQFAVNEILQYRKKIGAPAHAGGANWIFSDSTSGGRNTSEVSRASGEVDGVRLPKEAYYVCQVLFRDDPQVHILGHWTYPPERAAVKDLFVASNGDRVELFLNDRSLGFGQKSNGFLFTFPKVTWAAGQLRAEAYRGNQRVASTKVETAGAPVALRLTPILGPTGFTATGSEIALVDVEAVDAQGRRCPTEQRRVDFTLTGPAIWRGGYNSGKEHSTNNPWLDLEAGINRVAIKSTREGGPVQLVATAPGLTAATLQLTSEPVKIEHGAGRALPARPLLPGRLAGSEPPIGPGPGPEANAPVMAQNTGNFTATFSYSGPTPGAQIKPNAQKGEPIYCSGSSTFDSLPRRLAGADYAQLPPADRRYSAVDLISISAHEKATLYLAHDDRLQKPKWLTDAFTKTDDSIKIDSHPCSIYQRPLPPGESVTLGGNQDGVPPVPDALMYVVLIQPSPK